MINQDKPNTGTPETYLEIGGGYFLTIGSTFKLIIGALGLGGMTNLSKVSQGLTWATIQTTWASEPKTWLGISQIIDNITKSVTSITNQDKP